jgi:hypothetical protein
MRPECLVLAIRENTANIPPAIANEAQELPLLDLSDEAAASLPVLDLTAGDSAENPYDATILETDQFGEDVNWPPCNVFVPLATQVPAEAQTWYSELRSQNLPYGCIRALDRTYQRGTQRESRNSREGVKSRKGVERRKSRKWF